MPLLFKGKKKREKKKKGLSVGQNLMEFTKISMPEFLNFF